MSEYCTIKGYECGLSLGENRCVMDKPCTDIAEWIVEHDKQIRAEERAKTIDEFVNRHDKCDLRLCDKVNLGISCCKCIAEQMKGVRNET